MLRPRALGLVALFSALPALSLAQPSPAGRAASPPSASSTPPGVSAPPASSAPPGTSGTPGATEAKLAEAKELFRRGNALRKAGSLDAALELFFRSRALVPSIANTQNAAVMLDELGRSDEAIELYETLLVEFAGKLSEDDRRDVSAAIGLLRGRVGAVFVSANVDGAVIVDGHKRGELPLNRPIRLRVGEHRVLVLRDGFAPAEAPVSITVGKTAIVDLKLEPLAAAGRLSVTDEAGAAEVAVLVDGAPVGPAPWAGQLAPGRHLISLRGKEVGTAPREVTILVGQTVSFALRSEPIGPPVRIETDPPSARLTLDGVALGPGPFQGQLPLRDLTLIATEEGYLREEKTLGSTDKGSVLVRLRVDEKHPRWRKVEPLRFRVEATLGGAVGTSLNSDAEAACPDTCSSRQRPRAWLAGVRGAVLLPRGLEFTVGAGYLGVSAKVERELPSGGDYSFHAQDSLSVAGPFATIGVGYGLRLTEGLRVAGSASLGAFLARSRDAIEVEAVRGAERAPMQVDRAGGSARAVDLFALTEVRAELSRGAFHAGLGLGLGLFFLDGPALPHGEAFPSAITGCADKRSSLACIQGTSQFAGERAYHFHLMELALLSAGMTF